MYKYKLMKKRNPQKPDEPQKWYAAPMSEAALSVKAMTRAATENTTTAPIEMESAFELFMRYAVQQLQQGHTVRVGNRFSQQSEILVHNIANGREAVNQLNELQGRFCGRAARHDD